MKRLQLLDYGRFTAAMIVVLFHYTFNGIQNGKIASLEHTPWLIELTKYGYLGVELFFMISGYVIFFSARSRSASQFAVSRAIRLYPSFWFAVLFTAVFASQWGGSQMSVSLAQVIANFSMVAPRLGYDFVDGVYWTLTFELNFYAAVFVLLLVGMQRHLETIFIAWPLIMLVALLTEHNDIGYLGGYYYYFAAGALFAISKERQTWPVWFALIVAYALCVYFSVGWAQQISSIKNIPYSEPVVAGIISVFFIFFAFLNSPRGAALRLPGAQTLGALTYPVYLIHAHFGYMFLSQFATEKNKLAMYLTTIGIVLLVSYAMHQLIEVRGAKLWRSVFSTLIGRSVRAVEQRIDRLRTNANSLAAKNQA